MFTILFKSPRNVVLRTQTLNELPVCSQLLYTSCQFFKVGNLHLRDDLKYNPPFFIKRKTPKLVPIVIFPNLISLQAIIILLSRLTHQFFKIIFNDVRYVFNRLH